MFDASQGLALSSASINKNFLHVPGDLVVVPLDDSHLFGVLCNSVLVGVSDLHRVVVVFFWLLMFLGSYIAIRDINETTKHCKSCKVFINRNGETHTLVRKTWEE